MLYIHRQDEFHIIASYRREGRQFVAEPTEIGTTMWRWQDLPQLQYDLQNASLVITALGQKRVQIDDRELPAQELIDRVYALRPSQQPEESRSGWGAVIYRTMAKRLATVIEGQDDFTFIPSPIVPTTLHQKIIAICKCLFVVDKEAVVLADAKK